jgi:lycopene beta-cyclase
VTYLQFLVLFLVFPIAVLLARGPRPDRKELVAMGLMALIAFVYTTPWDNYLVATGMWGYGTDRVLGTIGYVPVEEYAFFILQPVLVALWAKSRMSSFSWDPVVGRPLVRVVGAVVWIGISVLGLTMLSGESRYMGLLLTWAGPPLAIQWAYGGDWLLARASALLPIIAVPTIFLWLADRLALALGIWEIHVSVGAVLGLPIEEMLFFLLTTMLVAQGYVLALPVLREGRIAPRPIDLMSQPRSVGA